MGPGLPQDQPLEFESLWPARLLRTLCPLSPSSLDQQMQAGGLSLCSAVGLGSSDGLCSPFSGQSGWSWKSTSLGRPGLSCIWDTGWAHRPSQLPGQGEPMTAPSGTGDCPVSSRPPGASSCCKSGFLRPVTVEREGPWRPPRPTLSFCKDTEPEGGMWFAPDFNQARSENQVP